MCRSGELPIPHSKNSENIILQKRVCEVLLRGLILVLVMCRAELEGFYFSDSRGRGVGDILQKFSGSPRRFRRSQPQARMMSLGDLYTNMKGYLHVSNY